MRKPNFFYYTIFQNNFASVEIYAFFLVMLLENMRINTLETTILRPNYLELVHTFSAKKIAKQNIFFLQLRCIILQL